MLRFRCRNPSCSSRNSASLQYTEAGLVRHFRRFKDCEDYQLSNPGHARNSQLYSSTSAAIEVSHRESPPNNPGVPFGSRSHLYVHSELDGQDAHLFDNNHEDNVSIAGTTGVDSDTDSESDEEDEEEEENEEQEEEEEEEQTEEEEDDKEEDDDIPMPDVDCVSDAVGYLDHSAAPVEQTLRCLRVYSREPTFRSAVGGAVVPLDTLSYTRIPPIFILRGCRMIYVYCGFISKTQITSRAGM